MNKKADLTAEQLIFLVANSLFFGVLLFFIVNSGGAEAINEEILAKKLALLVDNMKPGMEVKISVEELVKAIEENKFYEEFPIKVENQRITVKLRKGEGYGFGYFSNVNPFFSLDRQTKLLTIKT